VSNEENVQPPATELDAKAPKVRKPYRKPAFRFERVFETSALSCGKVSQAQQQCKTSRKAS